MDEGMPLLAEVGSEEGREDLEVVEVGRGSQRRL